jgi:Flp pilus assembly protein TadG
MNIGWHSLLGGILAGLGALRHDARGSTLAMCAAAVIPLLLIIGSGLDMSRAYMAKLRMQQACDAGSLAGRRVLENDTINESTINEAKKFFNFNFPQNAFQTASFTPSVTKPSSGVIRITASTTIPTSIMKIFGYTSLPLSVDCKAEQHFINTDVMLVLDTTGSMDDPVGGIKKIVSLRAAVLALYDQLAPIQTQLENAGMRLRYGIVPYSITVHTGNLVYALDNSYIKTTWNYQQCTANCSSGTKTWGSVPVAHTGTWMTNTWGGCIEERSTITSINISADLSIPANAYDVQIDTIPTNDATRWGPYDTSAQQREGSGTDSTACPAQAKRMQAWTRANLSTYLDTLSPRGYTYHDIGMVWGARLLSPDGIFATDNPNTYNGMGVNRFLVFMTDGDPVAAGTAYTAWGVETYDQRITGGNGQELERHVQRMNMVCNALKAKNVSIWVVGFDNGINYVDDCASNPNQAAVADDQAELIAKFTEIGQTIGALRLSQ